MKQEPDLRKSGILFLLGRGGRQHIERADVSTDPKSPLHFNAEEKRVIKAEDEKTKEQFKTLFSDQNNIPSEHSNDDDFF